MALLILKYCSPGIAKRDPPFLFSVFSMTGNFVFNVQHGSVHSVSSAAHLHSEKVPPLTTSLGSGFAPPSNEKSIMQTVMWKDGLCTHRKNTLHYLSRGNRCLERKNVCLRDAFIGLHNSDKSVLCSLRIGARQKQTEKYPSTYYLTQKPFVRVRSCKSFMNNAGG